MVWIGPSKLRVRRAAKRLHIARCQLLQQYRRAMPMASCARVPFGLRAQQIFLGDHLENRADVLRHAAVHQHEALLQSLRVAAEIAIRPENRVARQQAAAADAEFGIALGSRARRGSA